MIYTHIKLKVVVVDIFSGGRNHQPDGSGPIHVQAYFFKVLERNFGGGLGSKQRKWARVLVVQCAEMGGMNIQKVLQAYDRKRWKNVGIPFISSGERSSRYVLNGS